MEKRPQYLKFDREINPLGELSNFWPHSTPLIYQGKAYRTAEHLYQSRKYQYNNCSEASREYAEVIRTASTPFKAKLLAQQKCLDRFAWQVALGKIVLDFRVRGALQDPNWDEKKLEIMQEIVQLKFNQDRHCREVLLGTSGSDLVESSRTDKYWADGGDGNGENHLGRLLTKLRDTLLSKRDASPERR